MNSNVQILYRSFDDGLAECGLVCPYEILALDHNLLKENRFEHNIKRHINTNFPCG